MIWSTLGEIAAKAAEIHRGCQDAHDPDVHLAEALERLSRGEPKA